jgi:hypothetical protein
MFADKVNTGFANQCKLRSLPALKDQSTNEPTTTTTNKSILRSELKVPAAPAILVQKKMAASSAPVQIQQEWSDRKILLLDDVSFVSGNEELAATLSGLELTGGDAGKILHELYQKQPLVFGLCKVIEDDFLPKEIPPPPLLDDLPINIVSDSLLCFNRGSNKELAETPLPELRSKFGNAIQLKVKKGAQVADLVQMVESTPRNSRIIICWMLNDCFGRTSKRGKFGFIQSWRNASNLKRIERLAELCHEFRSAHIIVGGNAKQWRCDDLFDHEVTFVRNLLGRSSIATSDGSSWIEGLEFADGDIWHPVRSDRNARIVVELATKLIRVMCLCEPSYNYRGQFCERTKRIYTNTQAQDVINKSLNSSARFGKAGGNSWSSHQGQ